MHQIVQGTSPIENALIELDRLRENFERARRELDRLSQLNDAEKRDLLESTKGRIDRGGVLGDLQALKRQLKSISELCPRASSAFEAIETSAQELEAMTDTLFGEFQKIEEPGTK